ncbi:MAG: glycerophosphoryl diester phosphodiesterase [Acidimicrobiales bacterium]|nr:glycerophosphoryl diester phosphodiesterase [Acidimicrobiales bacterium]
MRTLAFAHRGGTDGGHPESSLAAFADALARGCDLETDVRLAADGVPVLVHDALRFRGGRPVVPAWTSSTRLHRLGVVPLTELYGELGRDYELSIDVKVVRAAGPALEVARRAGAIERLWLVHDDLAVLDTLRREEPRVRLVHEARHADLARLGRTAAEHVALLAEHRVDAKNTHWAHWTPDLVAIAHAAGVLAFGSLVQEPPAMREAVDRGLDGLYSDHLDALVDAVRSAPAAGA